MPTKYINRHTPFDPYAMRITGKQGVQTTEGLIGHQPYKGIYLPVAVDVTHKDRYPEPLRICGRLAFVLPGGGVHVP
jgi:hypothetical protein